MAGNNPASSSGL